MAQPRIVQKKNKHAYSLSANNCLPWNTCQIEAILTPLFTYLAPPTSLFLTPLLDAGQINSAGGSPELF